MIKLGFIFLDGCKGYKARLIKTKPATHDILGEIPILPSHTTKPLMISYYLLILVPDIAPPLKPLVTNGPSFYRNFYNLTIYPFGGTGHALQFFWTIWQ